MIIVKYNDSETFNEVSFKRISEHVVSIKGSQERGSNGFTTYTAAGVPLGDFSGYKTVYAEPTEDEVQYSNDGSVKPEEPAVEPVVPKEPTADEIKQMLIDGVQNWMDEVAASRGYDGILSVCTYIDTGVERFDTEGEQARKWRSQVWAYCYAYLDEVLAGTRTIPTLEELIEELPKLDWTTPEQ